MGDLVTIARCYEQSEAAVVRALLEQHGIHCVDLGARHLSVAPQLMAAMQGIELRVAVEDAADARALLAHASPDETYETCPYCGSARQFRQASYLNLLFCVLMGFMAGLPVMVMYRRTGRRYCYDCRDWWQAPRKRDEDAFASFD